MILPNFLIIGAGKSGTTSIYRYLSQHPQVFMSPIKETNFLVYDGGNPLIRRQSPDGDFRIKSLEAYAALFRDAGGAKAIGEASPRYLVDPRAAERIRHRLPDVRLIVMLRHPVERAYSSYSMHLRDRREPRSFERAIADEERGVHDGVRSFGQQHYLGIGYYARHLQVYFRLFDREQIAVNLFEDLQADAGGLMRRLFRFLEVDEAFTPDSRVHHNRSGIVPNPLLRPLLQKSLLTRTARRLLPGALAWRAEAVQRAWRDRVAQPPPALAAEIRARLSARYRDDILALQDLIGRDLSHWLA